MKKTLGFVATWSAIAFCACSSSSSSGSSSTPNDGGATTNDAGSTACSATASGGTSETFQCGYGAVLLKGTTEIGIQSSGAGQSDGVQLLFEIDGPPTATTYTGANVIDALSSFKSADKSSEWQQQSANGTDSKGTFTLTITDPGATTDLGAGGTGYASHGTYTGTFVQVSTDGSATPVDGGAPATLTVTF